MAQMKDDSQFEQEHEEARSTEWGYLNVKDFQIRGWAVNEDGERVQASMADPVCNPYKGKEDGREFYRVRMNDGAEFETAGETADISRHSAIVSAKQVRPSKRFPGSVGIAIPSDGTLTFQRSERLEDGSWTVASEVKATLDEARAAQSASGEAYRRKQAQSQEKAPEPTPEPKASQSQSQDAHKPEPEPAHTVAGVAKQARAKAQAANDKQGAQAQSQDAPKPKQVR